MTDARRRTALVTGASSGIGRAIAARLGAAGVHVLVHYRQGGTEAGALVDQIRAKGGSAEALSADLSQPEEIRQLAEALSLRVERLDLLVNNAGGADRRIPFDRVDESTFDAAIALNLRAPFLLTQQLLPLLRNAQGTVINLSTALTRKVSNAGLSAYVAAKGGLNALTLALAGELAPLGIRVVCLAPGVVITPLQERLSSPERLARRGAESLLGRLATPEDVAGIVAFLASDSAIFLNGQVLSAEGQ